MTGTGSCQGAKSWREKNHHTSRKAKMAFVGHLGYDLQKCSLMIGQYETTEEEVVVVVVEGRCCSNLSEAEIAIPLHPSNGSPQSSQKEFLLNSVRTSWFHVILWIAIARSLHGQSETILVSTAGHVARLKAASLAWGGRVGGYIASRPVGTLMTPHPDPYHKCPCPPLSSKTTSQSRSERFPAQLCASPVISLLANLSIAKSFWIPGLRWL